MASNYYTPISPSAGNNPCPSDNNRSCHLRQQMAPVMPKKFTMQVTALVTATDHAPVTPVYGVVRLKSSWWNVLAWCGQGRSGWSATNSSMHSCELYSILLKKKTTTFIILKLHLQSLQTNFLLCCLYHFALPFYSKNTKKRKINKPHFLNEVIPAPFWKLAEHWRALQKETG